MIKKLLYYFFHRPLNPIPANVVATDFCKYQAACSDFCVYTVASTDKE